MKKLLLLSFFVLFFSGQQVFAQEGAVIFGDLQLGQNFYIKNDKFFGDFAPPQYSKQKASTDSWLSVNYKYKFVTAGIRYDIFYNSGLRNPQESYTNNGIGNWFVNFDLGRFDLTGGFIYDQFGSGAAFRAFEERAQLLDYALQGLRIKYQLSDNWQAKFIVGKQKLNPLFADDLTDTYSDVITGFNLEGYLELGQGWSIAPGISLVNRGLSDKSYDELISNVDLLPENKKFTLDYNTQVYSVYGNLDKGGFSLSAEYNYKTPEPNFRDLSNPDATDLIQESGSFFLGSASYAQKGLGVTLQYRNVKEFNFRNSPLESLNSGLISYVPAFSQQNSYRLTTLYVPAAQLKDEQGVQLDVVFKLNKKNSLELNGSYIENEKEKLYHEVFLTHKLKPSKKWRVNYGVQLQDFNDAVYNGHQENENVKTITPFTDITYKFGKRNSIRVEASHLSTAQDRGDWSWAMAEINLKSKYTFSVSNMYNYGNKVKADQLQFWTVFAGMNMGEKRFSIAYVQQPEAVICSGGVCRLEPAFNGVKANLNISF